MANSIYNPTSKSINIIKAYRVDDIDPDNDMLNINSKRDLFALTELDAINNLLNRIGLDEIVKAAEDSTIEKTLESWEYAIVIIVLDRREYKEAIDESSIDEANNTAAFSLDALDDPSQWTGSMGVMNAKLSGVEVEVDLNTHTLKISKLTTISMHGNVKKKDITPDEEA